MPLTQDHLDDIAAARADMRPTCRAESDGMDAHLCTAHPVGDHGYVRVIDDMGDDIGDDTAIVQAVRVHHGVGTKKARDDAGLIRYLMRHWHSMPFDMCVIK